MEKEKVLAEAVIGFEAQKIVLGPLTEEDADVFRAHGYAIWLPEEFDLQKIKRS